MPHSDTVVGESTIAGNGLFATAALGPGVLVAGPDELAAVNHSCAPNLGWSGAAGLVTLRAVEAGEELTYDYATWVDDPGFLLRCHCETYRCRQLIEGTDWQIRQLQQRYAGHWAPHVQRRIDGG